MDGARRRVDAIATGSREVGALPAVVWTAGAPGPTVAITANIHGDEVAGTAACHALDERLPGWLTRGTVVLYPSLNPRGLQTQARAWPDDGVDLNRMFPGEPTASGTARAAALIWTDLLSRRPDALLDLHSDSAVAVPYVLVDRATGPRGGRRQALEQQMRAMAAATRLFVLQEYPSEEYVRFRLDRSLAGAMVNHARIPALTLEVGARRVVDPAAVGVLVEAVGRVLGHFGLVDPPPDGGPTGDPETWRRAAAPRVSSGGVFSPRLRPGEAFRAGEVLGTVRALDGTVREVVRAEGPGRVISWIETAWLEARAVPGTLAIPEAG